MVLELVAARGGGHFTAADLAADARSRRSGVGRATIFRTLDLLLEIGAIERIDLPDGEHAYVACQTRHHHHIVCTGCGRSTDVDDTDLRAALGTLGRATGYAIDGHRLELYGRCPACRGTTVGASVSRSRAIRRQDLGACGRRATSVVGALAVSCVILLAACQGAVQPGSAAPSSSSGTALRVVATTTVFADIVRQVGGERASVTSIIPAGVGPEDYDPRPEDARRLADADLVVSNGAGLDDFLDQLDRPAPAPRRRVSCLTDGIPTS